MGQYLWNKDKAEWYKQEGDNLYPTEEVSVDTLHHEIHEGNSFVTFSINSSIANNQTYSTYFITGKKYLHIISEGTLSGDYYSYFFGSVIGSSGTPLTVVNRKRDSSVTSSALFYSNTSITNYGTAFSGSFNSGGTGPKAIGSSNLERDEFILKTLTAYAISIVNISGNSQKGSMKINFYEEYI